MLDFPRLQFASYPGSYPVRCRLPMTARSSQRKSLDDLQTVLDKKAARNINLRLTAAHAAQRDVHREHEEIFRAALDRQEARAALALEAHVRLTLDIVKRQAQVEPRAA